MNNQMYNNQMYNQPKKKSNKWIILIVIILLLALLTVIGYNLINKDVKEEVAPVEEKKEVVEESNSNKEETSNEQQTTEEEEEYIVEDIYAELDEQLKSNDPLTIGIALWDYTIAVATGEDSVWKRKVEASGEPVCQLTINDIKKRFTTDFKANGASYYNADITEFIGTCDEYGKERDDSYIDTTFELKSSNAKQIVLTTKSTYCSSYGCVDKKVAKTIEKEFIIKKVNGNWLVSNFYMPY